MVCLDPQGATRRGNRSRDSGWGYTDVDREVQNGNSGLLMRPRRTMVRSPTVCAQSFPGLRSATCTPSGKRGAILVKISQMARYLPAVMVVALVAAQTSRPRARDLGLTPGVYSTGPLNAITDVAGVRVGHVT